MLIEEGLLSGIGESAEDIIKSLHIMKEMNVSQGRSMTFIPQHGTPMEHEKQPDFIAELKLIAVLRLYISGYSDTRVIGCRRNPGLKREADGRRQRSDFYYSTR